MNHTPGPWATTKSFTWRIHSKKADPRSLYPGHTQGIAQMCDAWDEETTVANAKLIAAAPDLLTACETALSVLHLCRYLPKAQEASATLTQAIAKAKGTDHEPPIR